MGDITTGSASATTAKIAIEEMLSEGGRARGMSTSSTSANTTSSRIVGRKTVVSTAAVRWIHPPVLKVTRRAEGTVVRRARVVSVTRQQGEALICANLPPG